jgi:hypothetical protein
MRRQTMIKIESCPFCGGYGKLHFGYPNGKTYGLKIGFVKCVQCKAKTRTIHQGAEEKSEDFKRRVAKMWNRRASDGVIIT